MQVFQQKTEKFFVSEEKSLVGSTLVADPIIVFFLRLLIFAVSLCVCMM
jgi:hypothetical protein